MFTKITNQKIEIYNADTGQYLGTSTFDLPPEEEKKLLNLVNYGVNPSSLLILNARLYDAPEDYIPPSITEAKRRKGILTADFIEEGTQNKIPIEIQMNFDSRARGLLPGSPYYLNSVQYSDIVVESVDIFP